MGPPMDQLVWTFYRRHRIARAVDHFWASPLSYVDGKSKFEGYNSVYEHATVGDTTLGRFTYVAINSRVMNCSIGRYCSIGPGTLIGGLGVHPSKWLSTHPVFFSMARQAGGTTFAYDSHVNELPPVTVGNDVWIGARAIVLDGCRVGNGAIIAAGAVVTKDVKPYAIVGGVPAREIRMRFEPEAVAALLNTEWWEWPVEKLKAAAHLFRTSDIAAICRLSEETQR